MTIRKLALSIALLLPLTSYSTPFSYFQVFNIDTIYAMCSHYLSGADISKINVSSKDTDPHVRESHSTISELGQSSEDNVVPREGMYSKCELEVPKKKQKGGFFIVSPSGHIATSMSLE